MLSELTRAGVVHSVHHGIAVVKVAKGGCASCGEKSGCAIGRLASDGKSSLIEVTVPAGTRIMAGDSITLTMTQRALHQAALIGYLVPALALVVGATAGQTLVGSDLGSAVGALFGLLAGMIPGQVIARCRSHPEVRILEGDGAHFKVTHDH